MGQKTLACDNDNGLMDLLHRELGASVTQSRWSCTQPCNVPRHGGAVPGKVPRLP